MIITQGNESPGFMVNMLWLSIVHLFSIRTASHCVPQYGGLAGTVYPGSPGCTALTLLNVIPTVRNVELDMSNRQSPSTMPL